MNTLKRYPIIMLLLPACLAMLPACRQPSDSQGESPRVQHDHPLPAPVARDGLIPVGDLAPDFAGVDHTGVTRRLSDLLQVKNVVLVFYPADFTPGCTKQLCAVRDDWSEFERRNAIVLGVNPAEPRRHADFAAEYRFPFPVISDPNAHIAAAYGARQPDKPEHPLRTVYVIAQDGRVTLSERGMVPHERIFAALDRP